MSRTGSPRTHLLLFTDAFPYGARETFLEAEIGYLAEGFERVTVIPRYTAGACRSLPGNVQVEDSLAAMHRARSRAGSIARCLVSGPFYRELAERPVTLVQPTAANRLAGHAASALRVARWLESFSASRRIPLDRAICYTYWLGAETAGVGMARRLAPQLVLASRAHGIDVYAERQHPAYIPMQRFAVRSADAVFVVSADGCEYLRAKHPTEAERISVARLGVGDPGSVSAPSEDGRLRIVTCSRMEAVKRLELAIAGIAEFARQYPHVAVEWTHFGSGRLREAIVAAAQRELPSSVRWSLPGELPNAEVLHHFRRNPVDVFLNVSSSEGVPVSIMEAHSFGVPAIATAVGGVPEIVDGTTGVLLSADPAPLEIASALARFTDDGPAERALRAGSRARWRNRFHADSNFRQFLESIHAISQCRSANSL